MVDGFTHQLVLLGLYTPIKPGQAACGPPRWLESGGSPGAGRVPLKAHGGCV